MDTNSVNSKVVGWYNSNIDPYRNGILEEYRDTSRLCIELDRALAVLPVNLDFLLELLPTLPDNATNPFNAPTFPIHLAHRLQAPIPPAIEAKYPRWYDFMIGDILERLFIVLLNEEDNRIANIHTKLQVLKICYSLLSFNRDARVRLRIAVQHVETWIDEVYEAKTPELVSLYFHLIAFLISSDSTVLFHHRRCNIKICLQRLRYCSDFFGESTQLSSTT
jgi:hypothetical protein